MPIGTAPFSDRFTEWTPLARGAEGHLYRVQDRWTRRVGALKVGEGDAAREALVGEFRLLTVLRHPCLIRSEDLLVEGDTCAHLLEYVPATEPSRLWEEGGEDAVRAAVIQALRGLTYLHRNGFVHGDVAPGNVLVWREGEQWRARLADLGMTLPSDRAARAGIRGTPGYWAPEVARGEGLTAASDLYSLAATATAWIDGRGPWEGLGSAQLLQVMSSGSPVPKPRRRISPELESLLTALGAGHPEARTRWDWGDLRRDESHWGPPTVTATVSGLDPHIQDWMDWSSSLPEGTVGSLILRGRLGTGRTTAARSLGRSMVAAGWAGIWQFPRWVGHPSDVPEAEARDPVLIARELNRAMQHRDVVLFWPPRMPDSETRALRGFLASREDASSRFRTLVLKATPVETEDADLDWLLGATRSRLVDWTAPGADAIDSMRRDLFPPEDGVLPGPGFRADTSPLALVLHKQASIAGESPSRADDGAEALVQELSRLWDRSSLPSRQGLALLAWSDMGWVFEELAMLLGWSEGNSVSVLGEWNRLRLTRRRFEQGKAIDALTDELTRAALLDRAPQALTVEILDRLVLGLERGEFHEGDLRLARRLLASGREIPRYLLSSLESALAEGRFEEILELADEADTGAITPTTLSKEVWRLLLAAAQSSGKYAAEVRALRRLISEAEGRGVILERKQLAQALANLGDWQGALEECRHIIDDPDSTPPQRIWAELQSAETLWQAGRFTEADQAYEAVRLRIAPEMIEEWLRFSVGRARQHGQRGDMSGVKQYLELAVSTVGKERCEQDPMYLNTLGGLLMQEAGYGPAHPVLSLGQQRARTKLNWQAYVMISGRLSAVEYGLGSVWNALKTGRDSLSVALATGNRRSSSMMSSFIGHYELHSGNIGLSLRTATALITDARRLGDLNLELQGLRLLVTIAAGAGLESELDGAMMSIQSVGGRTGEVESQSYASLCLGMYWIGCFNHERAIKALTESLSLTGRLGKSDNELHAKLLLAVTKRRVGERSELKEALDHVGQYLKTGRYPLLNPLLTFAEAEALAPNESSPAVEHAIEAMWESGRLLELLDWYPFIHNRVPESSQRELKKKVVRIAKRAADSLDDAHTRSRFLAFPKVVRSLQLASG